MQVERVVVQEIHVDILQDNLHGLVIFHRQRFRSPVRRQVVLEDRGARCEVENLRRVRREVCCVHSFLLVVIGLQNRTVGRDVEGHIVEGGCNFGTRCAIFGRRAHNIRHRRRENKVTVRGAGKVGIDQPKQTV